MRSLNPVNYLNRQNKTPFFLYPFGSDFPAFLYFFYAGEICFCPYFNDINTARIKRGFLFWMSNFLEKNLRFFWRLTYVPLSSSKRKIFWLFTHKIHFFILYENYKLANYPSGMIWTEHYFLEWVEMLSGGYPSNFNYFLWAHFVLLSPFHKGAIKQIYREILRKTIFVPQFWPWILKK